jgi:hypothetical protein
MNEDVMPEAATQAARQAATESAPSGQQGQSSEPAWLLAMPIISAQGMESESCEAGIALASGAAQINCTATST